MPIALPSTALCSCPDSRRADGIDAPRVWGAGLDWLGRPVGEVFTRPSFPTTAHLSQSLKHRGLLRSLFDDD